MRVTRAAAAARIVVGAAARANGPARLRVRGTDVVAAELDHAAELPELDRSRPPWPGQIERADGDELFIRHTPATAPGAETAVFVHGLGGASTNWTDLAAQISPWVQGFAPDLPGFGRSGPSASHDYTIPEHTRVITRYLDRLAAAGSGPVHLFGNSMGGAVAIAVAARRPDLVRTLTLISPAVPDLRALRNDDPRAALLLIPGMAKVAMRRLGSATPEARARGLIELCFGDQSKVSALRVAEAADEIRHRQGMAWADEAFLWSLRGLVRSFFSAQPWHDMQQITAPTLVIWGDRDRLVSPSLAPVVAQTVPRARLLMLFGVGHVAQLEQPATTARAWLALRAQAAPAGHPAAMPTAAGTAGTAADPAAAQAAASSGRGSGRS